ncbi:MAG: hypothetical protein ACRENF_05425 [Thermodesulfobacteriota bacterium]
MNPTKTPTLGRVEKSGLIVTGLIIIANALLGSSALAFGAAVGGLLVIANFLAIRLVVGALIGNAYSKGFSVFIVLVKMAVLVAIVVSLFIFTKINIYGFFIGVTGVVIVIIGENLRGNKNGTL